jgi:outer membrane protein OmpA-like peptidoglycan-associated protein
MRASKKVMWLGFVAALGVGSCATRTRTGALVGGTGGAVLGAGAGAVAGGNKGAVIGAAAGAAAGAGAGALIGRYMDKQQKELEKKVETAKIEREGDRLVVKFNSAILFDVNEAELKPESKKDLSDFANVLKQYKETDLVIEGHTDSTGPRAFNKELSLERATAVIDFLTAQGVERDRLTPRGFASDRPVASNTTETGRQQNRRVQIQIEANEELQRQDAEAAKPEASNRRDDDRRATASR